MSMINLTSRRPMVFLSAALVLSLSACAQQSTTRAGSQQSMKPMDTNKDNQVSEEEYMKYQKQKFETMDQNKDKRLSQEEWALQQLQIGSEGE